jgi:hypothetical protein
LYEVSNVVEWFAGTWCVVHLLDKVFENYPGIRTLGRWATWGATTIAVATTLTVARVFWSGAIGGKPTLFYFEVVDRSVLLSLALVVILTLAFLSRYPMELQMNSWVSVTGFSAVILSLAGARLADSMAQYLTSMRIDIAQLVFEMCVYFVWAAALRREEAHAPSRVIFHRDGEAELVAQLEAMNGILRGAGRS